MSTKTPEERASRNPPEVEERAQRASRNRPLAVYTDADDLDPTPGIELLEANGFEVTYLKTTDPEAIVAGARDAEALLVGYAPITAEMIAALPQLKIIALSSSGVDQVDLDAARAHGVCVANLPALAAEEVGSHALALALSLLREVPFFAARAAHGDWLSRPPVAPARISATRLGLIGLGHIGTVTARQASGLFGEVVGYDPYLPETAETEQRLKEAGVRRVSLEELLSASGVVSLHLPLTSETHHLIDAAAIAMMPPGSTLVNASRGGLVDVHALRAAIDSGHLRGAALDVLEVEPPDQGHPLVGHPRVLLTPHVGYLSDHTLREYIRVQAQNVVSFHERGEPDNPVVMPGIAPHPDNLAKDSS